MDALVAQQLGSAEIRIEGAGFSIVGSVTSAVPEPATGLLVAAGLLVLGELQKLNRSDDGKRKNRHHQWLSEDVGNPALLRHLGAVIGLMKISSDYDEFEKHLDKLAPISDDMPLFARTNDL